MIKCQGGFLIALLIGSVGCGDDGIGWGGSGGRAGAGGSGGIGGTGGTGGTAGSGGTGGMAGSGCTARTSGFVTDLNPYPEPALPTLPSAGGTFTDPTFGTTILRATDGNDGPNCTTAYSYWPTFNVNSTRIQIAIGGGNGATYRFDPVALVLSDRQPLYVGPAPGGGTPFQEDAIWSASDPDLLLCHEGARVWSYNVTTHAYVLVKDFSARFPGQYLWQMSRSMDDQVFAFTRRENVTYAVLGYFAWRRDNDTILLDQDAETLDEVQVDKTGQYLVVKTGEMGATAIEVRVADLSRGMLFADLTDGSPDFAPGHSDNGHGTVLGADNWMNRITFRQLATPHQLSSALDFGNDWTQGAHLSLLADDEARALVSLYDNGAHTSGRFHDEIIELSTDGSQSVRRLAHHRSLVQGYDDTPRANISRDGCFVAFTSNWGGSGRRDVFILKLSN